MKRVVEKEEEEEDSAHPERKEEKNEAESQRRRRRRGEKSATGREGEREGRRVREKESIVLREESIVLSLPRH